MGKAQVSNWGVILSRRNVIIGAILLVVFTFTATAGGFLYLLNGKSNDIMSSLKFFRALEMVKERYVEPMPIDTLIAGAVKREFGCAAALVAVSEFQG